MRPANIEVSANVPFKVRRVIGIEVFSGFYEKIITASIPVRAATNCYCFT